MVESMRGSSYDLAIVDIKRDKLDEESYRQFFARKGICGVIVRSTAADRAIVSTMAEQGCQMVVLGDHFPDQRVAFVHGSSYGASTEAVEHLISLGHQRIAFSASESDDGDHCDRFAAYCDALRRAGLYDEDLVCRVPPHRLDGAQLLRKLMAMVTPPTAILIGDPHIAVGVVNEAHQLRINLPTELSIVGFDDNDTRSSLFPRMTAVCQDSRMLGQLAFATLLRILGGEATPLSPAPHHAAWLEINSTTGPAPKVQSRVLTNGVRLPVETI
jgi:DNA-binding LacI/PurR family transcriptional regulator